MKPRHALLASVGTLAVALAILSQTFFGSDRVTGSPPVPAGARTTLNGSGRAKEFHLTVGRTRWELAPGKTVDAFAYDGQVPGPDLRVTEGDPVRISVQNNLAEPTTVHWHGVHVPANMDGVPGLSQEPIAPGGVFTYEFVATPAGTRWYHAHVDNVAQQANGLVGPLIIEPKDAPATKPYREYTLLTEEWITGIGSMPVAPTPGPSTTTGMPGGMMGQGPGGVMGQGPRHDGLGRHRSADVRHAHGQRQGVRRFGPADGAPG